jgi:hypothetical protein
MGLIPFVRFTLRRENTAKGRASSDHWQRATLFYKGIIVYRKVLQLGAKTEPLLMTNHVSSPATTLPAHTTPLTLQPQRCTLTKELCLLTTTLHYMQPRVLNYLGIEHLFHCPWFVSHPIQSHNATAYSSKEASLRRLPCSNCVQGPSLTDLPSWDQSPYSK